MVYVSVLRPKNLMAAAGLNICEDITATGFQLDILSIVRASERHNFPARMLLLVLIYTAF